jgi:hypothetical protein
MSTSRVRSLTKDAARPLFDFYHIAALLVEVVTHSSEAGLDHVQAIIQRG